MVKEEIKKETTQSKIKEKDYGNGNLRSYGFRKANKKNPIVKEKGKK